MHVMIIGAAGMVGGKLARSLASDPPPGLARLTLFDMVEPVAPAAECVVATAALDIRDRGAVATAIAARPDVIYHLAAVVSGEAEADFEKGYAVNFDGTRNLLDEIRALPGYAPKLIFTSSIAVFGAPFPETIPEEFFLTPLTSYGTQKAMGELMLADYSRAGLSRRHRPAPADDLHPPRPAEQGGLGVLFRYPARAARGQAGGAAGVRRSAPLACQPARGGGVPAPRADAGHRSARARAGA